MARLLLPQRSLVLVGGVPGSGKSHLVESIEFSSLMDVFKISADDVRGAVQVENGHDFHDYVEECIEEARERFFLELHEAVSDGDSIVIEASYLSERSRAEMIEWADAYALEVHMFLVTATWRECVEGVVRRDRKVPIDVLAGYWKQYQEWLPRLEAGHLDKGMASLHILSRTETIDEVAFAYA